MTSYPWPVLPLSELAEVRLGRQRSPKNHSGSQMRPYLRAANVGWSGLILDDVKEMNFTDEEMATYALRPGDLLLGEASGSPGEVGKPGLWKGELAECAFQNTLLRVRSELMEPEFLLHFFRHQALSGRFVEQSRGVGIHHLGRERLAKWPTPHPSTSEQRRIVAILEEHLSDLDAGLSYVDSAAARLVHLRRAELDRIFGPGVGPTLPLGDLIADVSAGKSFGSAERPAAPDEWGIIKVSAMTWGEFRSDENKAVSGDRVDPRFEIRAGDLLVSRANTSDYVGASVLVPAGVRPKLLLSDKSLRVLPRPEINPEWLWRVLQAPGARRQISVLATGTKESMRNISQESLKRVVVPVVDGSEQGKSTAEFAEIESAIRRQLGILASLRSRAGGLRRAVLAAAFSGRLTGHGTDTELIEELGEEESA